MMLLGRRDFLRRAIGASAIAIINPAELLELLEPRRLIFPSIEIARPIAYTKVSELAAAYQRATTKLYRTFSRYTEEYTWAHRRFALHDVDTEPFRAEHMGTWLPTPEPVEREPSRPRREDQIIMVNRR